MSRRRTGSWASASTPAVVASAAGTDSSPPTAHSANGGNSAINSIPARAAVRPSTAVPSTWISASSPAPQAIPSARATPIGGRPTIDPSASAPTSSGLLKPSTGRPPGFHTNPCPSARFSAWRTVIQASSVTKRRSSHASVTKPAVHASGQAQPRSADRRAPGSLAGKFAPDATTVVHEDRPVRMTVS